MSRSRSAAVKFNDAAPVFAALGETTRLTLRMSDSLKTAVEAAATADSVSVNAWLVRAVKGALDRPPQRMRASGNRIKGYARS